MSGRSMNLSVSPETLFSFSVTSETIRSCPSAFFDPASDLHFGERLSASHIASSCCQGKSRFAEPGSPELHDVPARTSPAASSVQRPSVTGRRCRSAHATATSRLEWPFRDCQVTKSFQRAIGTRDSPRRNDARVLCPPGHLVRCCDRDAGGTRVRGHAR